MHTDSCNGFHFPVGKRNPQTYHQLLYQNDLSKMHDAYQNSFHMDHIRSMLHQSYRLEALIQDQIAEDTGIPCQSFHLRKDKWFPQDQLSILPEGEGMAA